MKKRTLISSATVPFQVLHGQVLHAGRGIAGGGIHASNSRTPVLWSGCLMTFLLLCACGSGGGGAGQSPGLIGQERAKPSGGTYFVDANQSGQATRLHLVEMSWARLVDVHDIDAEGRMSLAPAFRDFTINESIRSDGISYLLETNPITQKTRLVILRRRGVPDEGQGTFEDLLRFAADGLAPIVPRHDDGSGGRPYSLVARNATLVLRFDDCLEDGFEAQRDLGETARVLVGYPPKRPFGARHLFDPNHGGVVDGEFHSTRVLIDLTVSESEAVSMVTPQAINPLGLPTSLSTTDNPNVSIRIPTAMDAGNGQFELLRGLSGSPLSAHENGPVDHGASTLDIVRALRSGNSSDLNNGFLLDSSPPSVLGGWGLRVDGVRDDSDGRLGLDYLLSVIFTTVCRSAPKEGDVVSVGDLFLEVARDAAAPDVNGRVQGLRVRSLADRPHPPNAVLLGNAIFLSTYQQSDRVPSGCWVSFSPPPVSLPATGVSTDSEVLVRFSEPMDPASISPFDDFVLVRGTSSSLIHATNLIVGTLSQSANLKEFTFEPLQPLPHDSNTAETYHLRVEGATDLAGNPLVAALPPIDFEMEPTQAAVINGSTVMRFGSTDEVEPAGLPDFRGQFFFDFERELIRPRPATLTSFPIDRINPVPSIMIPYAPGVQTPLSPLGSKLQTVWRYCDLGWQVLDETKYDMDVFGLAWAPTRGSIINDFFERFEIALAHSRRLPDEDIDEAKLPKHPQSGLVPNFASNILNDPRSRQRVVHDREQGYRIRGTDLFRSTSDTIMLPYPLNRGQMDPVTYTWRDTSVLAKGGPNGAGIPLDVEAETPLGLEAAPGYAAEPNQVPSIGLPLLIEYRCFPSDTGLGLNPLDISLGVNSSPLPAFRVFSTGGVNRAGVTVTRDPDAEPIASGTFSPSSTPAGLPTRPDDNAFYIGQLDLIPRVSRAHSAWINTGIDHPNFLDPIVLPAGPDQPAGTEIVVEYRGAEGFTLSDLDAALGAPVDESLFPFDAQHLNAYGEVFARLPRTLSNGTRYDEHALLGTSSFPGAVQFLNGVPTWSSDIASIDGARYVQLRVTFASNIQTGLGPELSAIGLSYSIR